MPHLARRSIAWMARAVPVTLRVVAAESTAILLLVDRADLGHSGLNKAMLLARHLRAPLDLYLCEVSPSGRSRDSTQDGSRLAPMYAAAQAYLHALRQSIFSTDVEIRCESQVASSLADGLEQRLRRGAALLIIPVGAHILPQRHLGGNWSWLQGCNVPLLLARKRVWRPVPQFGAAVDLGADGDDEHGARLIGLAERLTRRCAALLEYLYVATGDNEGKVALEAWRRLGRLAAGTEARSALKGWLHCRQGEPREVLSGVIGERGYDLLMMGWPRRPDGALAGLNHEHAPPRSVRLLQETAGDLLLLPAVASGD